MIFLIVYDRKTQTRLVDHEFSDSDAKQAESQRASAEAQYAGNDGVEVILLRSFDRDTLMKTHSRYFFTAQELTSKVPMA
jgi:hypothetical protein